MGSEMCIRDRARGGWQVLVNWASGLSDWQDLNDIFESDPVSVAVYAEKKGLLKEPGWKRCKRYTKRQKMIG